jgi:hypothetical protein
VLGSRLLRQALRPARLYVPVWLSLPGTFLQRALMEEFEKEAEDLFPVFKKRTWSQRHVVWDPAQGVQWKPGAVGPYRPDTDVPAIEGLYFASEAFRGHSVGCDRAPRIAMSVTEKVLGRPIPEFKNSWHYR